MLLVIIKRGQMLLPNFAATSVPIVIFCKKVRPQLYVPSYSYLIPFWLESLRITSWAPPSTMDVAETRVSLAFSWSSGIERAPQLHMVDLTLLSDMVTLSWRGPAYGT